MLRLSFVSGIGAGLRAQLRQLDRLAWLPWHAAAVPAGAPAHAQAEPPAQPWPVRITAIAKRAGLFIAGGLLIITAAAFLSADPNASLPSVVLNFTAAGNHSGSPTGVGNTEAIARHRGARIDPRFADFYEKGRYGPLPIIAKDGTLPAEEFASPAVPANGHPIVSVIVSGLGLDETATRDAITRLPPEITLAFSPYARDLQELIGLARADGHEVLLQIPVEPFDYPSSDPGPLVLLVNSPKGSNIDRLHRAMGEATGYMGLLTSGRARFAASEPSIDLLAGEAKKRGLMLVDDGRSPVSMTKRLASQMGALAGEVDRRLDTRPSGDGTALALLNLERLAVEQGRAVGATQLYPVAVDRLVSWANSLKGKGLVLEPVSVQILPTGSEDAPQTETSAKNEHDGTHRH
jgi:polysaccharide deacetylase 2 family uncharacterized protein YibQ